MNEVREAGRSCTFHHRSQPSVEIEAEKSEATLHQPEFNATCSSVSDYLDIADGARVRCGRTLVSDLSGFLVKWEIGREACNELFSLLSAHGVSGLPKDCRSAKSSLRKVVIKDMLPDGSYFHFGIESEVSRHVALLSDSCEEIKLQPRTRRKVAFRTRQKYRRGWRTSMKRTLKSSKQRYISYFSLYTFPCMSTAFLSLQ